MAGSADGGPEARTPRRDGVRVPPYSVDVERALLGCALQDAGRVLEHCMKKQIVLESFHLQMHRTVYEAILDLQVANAPVDVVTVIDRLRETGKLEAIGGEEALAHLVESTPTAAHAEYYAQIVYENHLLRRMIAAAGEVTDDCYKGEVEAETLLGVAEEKFFSLSSQRHGVEKSWESLVNGDMRIVEKLITDKKGITGLSTGFADIDEKLLGLHGGDLIILAARPSMGKTSLALNMAENVALGARKKDPLPVAVFSLEMSAESLVRRMICSHAGVPSQLLSKGKVSKDQHASLISAADVLRKAKIYVDDTAGLEALDLASRARRLKRKYGIEFLVVDYLQLMNYSKYAGQGRQLETAAISRSLKGIAKELDVPVLVLSQLSRAPETRDSKSAVPKLSDLRDSGAIEQDADVVMLLRRPSRYKGDSQHDDKRLAIVDVAKHRNGPVGEVKLDFDEEFTRFGNRIHGTDPRGDSGEEEMA
jgi:replicative DNA helicase